MDLACAETIDDIDHFLTTCSEKESKVWMMCSITLHIELAGMDFVLQEQVSTSRLAWKRVIATFSSA